jgi:hypothetical protein
MYAIVRQGNGKFYTSTVFGYFYDVKSSDAYQRHLERWRSAYYIVWNEAKTHLTKVLALQPNTKYLIPQILITDTSKDNWMEDAETTMGCVNFLSRAIADELCASHEMPAEILEQCMQLENEFSYDPCPEVRTEKDIENLNQAVGGFHDAFIRSCKLNDDGTLHVCFDGTWGCTVELWFWDDVSYCAESRDPDELDPYWYSSSIFFHDGYIVLVDEADMTAEQLDDSYCWFKAKHMKYRIIPD